MKRIITFLIAALVSIGITVGASAQAHAYTAFAKCTAPGGALVQSTSWWNTDGTKTYHWRIEDGWVDNIGPFNTSYNIKQVLIGSRSAYYNSNPDNTIAVKEGYLTFKPSTSGPTAFYVTGKWYKLTPKDGYMALSTYSCTTSTYL